MKFVRWLFLGIVIVLKYVLTLILAITIIQHLITPIYKFPEGKKFEGTVFYNPYAHSGYSWLKMNLHAHSRAWGGLTDGKKQGNAEIIDRYTDMGYDIIGISNYHDPQHIIFKGREDSLTVYEYGYNLFKAHRLVVGYTPAKFREVSLFHRLDDRQYILNECYPDAKVLIVAHPQFGQGHALSDFKVMSNYQLIEVLNHYRYSEQEWDLALSSGKPVFIIGNDDMHDLDKPGEVGVRYTMVDGRETLAATLDELKQGNAYGVSAPEHSCKLKLNSCTIESNQLQIQFNDTADKILFISDQGIHQDSVSNSVEASYEIKDDESYVRVEAYKASAIVYLNPVIRTINGQLPKNEHRFEINWIATIGEKLALLLCGYLLIWGFLRLKVRF